MVDIVKPLARRNPDKMVVHIGSNDLTAGINTIDNLEKIYNEIKNINTNCEVIISECTIRKDRKGMEKKISDLNTNIRKFCRE